MHGKTRARACVCVCVCVRERDTGGKTDRVQILLKHDLEKEAFGVLLYAMKTSYDLAIYEFPMH